MFLFKFIFNSITISDIVIYFLMFYLFWLALKDRKKGIMFSNFIAALGMIGTFFGICVGLSNFNENNITQSIPILLQGMRTAFFTSLVGMSLSVALKFIIGSTKEKIIIDTTEEAILEQTNRIIELNENIKKISDILFKDSLRKKEQDEKLLKGISNLQHLELIKDSLKDIDLHIENVNKNIDEQVKNGVDVKTLLEELKLSSNNIEENIKNYSQKTEEHNKELIKEFRDFTKTMAENNNKAFIQALNESMKDLNAQLTEQFGENFKELNKAVFKLVEWQENYKDIVIETTENQKVIFAGINKAKDDLNKFAFEGERVSKITEDLSKIIDFTKETQKEFNNEVEFLNDVNQSAKELIPNLSIINSRIEDNLKTFKTSLDRISLGINEATNNTVNEMGRAYIELSNNISKNDKEYREILQNNVSSLRETGNKLVTSLNINADTSISKITEISVRLINEATNKTNTYIENINTLFEKTISNIEQMNVNLEKEEREIATKTSEMMEQMNNEINKSLKTNVENINKGLEAALNSSLKSLGDELATLSNKFVKDYTPLTESLKEIVYIAKGVRR